METPGRDRKASEMKWNGYSAYLAEVEIWLLFSDILSWLWNDFGSWNKYK